MLKKRFLILKIRIWLKMNYKLYRIVLKPQKKYSENLEVEVNRLSD